MWLFLIAGVVYLAGVAVVLYIRPAFMFTPEGAWKEFGIGQREDRYTQFPFWMFCLVWAIVSYVAVISIAPLVSRLPEVVEEEDIIEGGMEAGQEIFRPSLRNRNNGRAAAAPGPKTLPKGYYVLNKKATKLSGVPKYVYLGAEEPAGSAAETLDA